MLKVFRHHHRDQARCEWLALNRLRSQGHLLAPRPVWSDLDHPLPAIAMSRLHGAALADGPWTAAELAALLRLLTEFFAVLPGDELPRPDHSPAAAVGRLRLAWPDRVEPAWPDAVRRALGAAGAWLADVQREGLPRPGSDVFGRGDYNRSNFLRQGGRLLHLDFEDARRQERAFELAELVEHIKSRPTPDATWEDFAGAFDMKAAERARYLAARRLLATFWLLQLLPGTPGSRRNPTGTVERQSERLLALLGS